MRVYFVRPFLIQCIFCVLVYLTSAESLPMAKPEAVGLDPKKLEAVNEKMEALIEENRLTGGTVVIARKERWPISRPMVCETGGGITGREGYHFSNLFNDQGDHIDGGLDALGGGKTGTG